MLHRPHDVGRKLRQVEAFRPCRRLLAGFGRHGEFARGGNWMIWQVRSSWPEPGVVVARRTSSFDAGTFARGSALPRFVIARARSRHRTPESLVIG